MLPHTGRRLWLRLGGIFAIWTVLAVVLTAHASLLTFSAERARPELHNIRADAPLGELFLNTLAECLTWAALTVGIFWLGRRFPFGQERWRRSLAVHVGVSFLFAILQTVVMVLLCELIRRELPKPLGSWNILFFYFVAKFQQNLFFYWAVLAVALIINYYRELRERELRSSQLEAKLAQTQLQMLKMQLHPHFLFNTLNAISALIHQDVELADRMIARLGDLLRATLENANLQEVSLQQELDFIQPYLEIEKARLGARLTVNLDIDSAALDAQVPNLILQPLVENAIRHGIAPRTEPGRLSIEAHRDNGSVHIAVSDDGPGLKQSSEPSDGIGLANTRARLEKLYGPRHRLELSNGAGRGLRVGITIPYHVGLS